MKIPENCGECAGRYLCSKKTKYKGDKCLNFHNALESKLHTPNTTKATIQPCSRSGDCAHERVTGNCLGPECGVYLPAEQ